MKKQTDIPLEHLTDEQLDDFLAYTDNPFEENNQAAIQQRFHQKKRRPNKLQRYWKGTALAAASVMLLAGFTFADDLALIYKKHFGTETEVLLLNSDRLSQKAEDEGLELTAVASFKDADSTYFIAQLRDLTGDRLSEDTTLEQWTMMSGGNSRVIDYDADTKTATILTHAVSMDNTALTGYQLSAFSSHEQEFSETFAIDWDAIIQTETAAEWLDISKQSGIGGGYHEEQGKKLNVVWDELVKTALKPMVINEELSDRLTISNVAYKDGLLHIQVKEPNDVYHAAQFMTLTHQKTGNEIEPVASYQVDEGTHNNETGRSDYTEYVFDAAADELPEYKLSITGWDKDVYQKGSWTIQLKEPTQLPTLSYQDVTVKSAGASIDLTDIEVSPVQLRFTYSGDANGLPITIHFTDGSQKMLAIDHTSAGESESFVYEYGFSELDAIEFVEIGDTRLTQE